MDLTAATSATVRARDTALAALLIACVLASSRPNGQAAPSGPRQLQGTLEPADAPTLPRRGSLKGVSPIPGDGQGVVDAYRQAAQHAEFVPVWASGLGASGFWDFPGALSAQGGAFVEELVRGNGLVPLVHFSFIDKGADGRLILKTPERLSDATLSDPRWRQAYKDAVLDAVDAVRPRYLSIGNEVNRWYEQYGVEEDTGNGFQHFVSLYEETYDAVKAVSPDTTVFCVLVREIVSDLREADLGALGLFDPDRLDMVVLTSYPHSVRKDREGKVLAHAFDRPSDIPDDYYSRVLQIVPDKPLGFSEICWPSIEFFGGEEAQAAFITEATTRLTVDQGIDLRLFGWPWLHDLPGGDQSGLLKRDGTAKAAYEVWSRL